jgi:hypothetical protein
MLDQRRVEIERHRLPPKQRMHARKQLLEGTVELAQMPEVEARQEAAERGRIRHRVATQQRLRAVSAKQRRVVEALAARDQRLAQRQRLLRRRVTAGALLHRHLVEQLRHTQRRGQLPHQHEPRVRRHLLRRRRNPDQRRPPC